MAVRDVLVRWTTEVDQSQLIAAQKRVDGLLDTFKGGARIIQGFAAAFAGNAIVQGIKAIVHAADDVGDAAARIGVTAREFQILKELAEDAGASVGTVQTGFRTLANQMKEGTAEFAKLGVATKNADGSNRALLDVFFEVGGALGDTADDATRLQLAQKLLGRSAIDLLPAFTGGREGVAKMRAELEEYAVIFDDAFIEQAGQADKNLRKFGARIERLKVLLVSQVLPAFEHGVAILTEITKGAQKFVQSGHAMQLVLDGLGMFFLRWAAAKQLGTVMGLIRGIVPLLGGLLKRFLLFALPALIIDELITTFRGGDSLIRRFIDSMFGIGATENAIKLVTGAAKDLWETFKLVLDYLFDINQDGKQTADELTAAFLRASERIGEAFDALAESIGPRLWAGIKRAFTGDGAKSMIEKAVDPGEDVGAADVLKATPFGQVASRISNFGRGFLNGGEGMPLLNQPSLAAPRAGVTTVEAPDNRHQEIHVTVQGNVTPAVAREIATRTGSAIAPGRDRAAIHAAVGGSD